MKTIEAEEFKEQCMALLDELESEGYTITKQGRPVARLVPLKGTSADLIGSLSHKIKVRGDIFTTGITWDADAQS